VAVAPQQHSGILLKNSGQTQSIKNNLRINVKTICHEKKDFALLFFFLKTFLYSLSKIFQVFGAFFKAFSDCFACFFGGIFNFFLVAAISFIS